MWRRTSSMTQAAWLLYISFSIIYCPAYYLDVRSTLCAPDQWAETLFHRVQLLPFLYLVEVPSAHEVEERKKYIGRFLAGSFRSVWSRAYDCVKNLWVDLCRQSSLHLAKMNNITRYFVKWTRYYVCTLILLWTVPIKVSQGPLVNPARCAYSLLLFMSVPNKSCPEFWPGREGTVFRFSFTRNCRQYSSWAVENWKYLRNILEAR